MTASIQSLRFADRHVRRLLRALKLPDTRFFDAHAALLEVSEHDAAREVEIRHGERRSDAGVPEAVATVTGPCCAKGAP